MTSKFSAAVLSVFFDDLGNMLLTGVGVSQALAALKETSMDKGLVKAIGQMESKTREGQMLAQAVASTAMFPWIVEATLQAGEQAGKLSGSVEMLAQYFRRYSDMKKKMNSAFVYPAIVFVLLCGVMLFMSLNVVPRLKNLLPADAFDHGITRFILTLSGFLQEFWPLCLVCGASIITGVFWLFQHRPQVLERLMYRVPILGVLIKESSLAVYFFNLSVLLKSGVSLMRAIQDLNAVHMCATSQRVLSCRDYMFGGLSFWESLKADPFFPSAAVFTLRRGEEMARLDDYCFQLAQYFDRRVSARLDVLAQLVQPVLLAIGGMFLATIAFAFLMPIYGGLTRIAGG